MNPIGTIVESALAEVDVPISRLKYVGDEETYLVYFEFDSSSALRGDDIDLKYRSGVQISIFSKGDFTAVAEIVNQRMLAAGFTFSSSNELYENDTAVFQKIISYYYLP